jgi:CDP-glucose 4,6-dehydratase
MDGATVPLARCRSDGHQPLPPITKPSAHNPGHKSNEVTTVRELVEMVRAVYGNGAGRYGEGAEGPHEAGWLAQEATKACMAFGVTPQWKLAEAVSQKTGR